MRKNNVIARRAKPDEAIQVVCRLPRWANFSLDCFAFARNDGNSLNLFSYEQALGFSLAPPNLPLPDLSIYDRIF
ncbi:MAG: hypothetical protein HYW48_05955 [Deltaproteobacteria bacterium]|nr:hypothetical protein [Deltaproteobacteria bacterium]